MKKMTTIGLLTGLLILCSISSYGATFTFTPNPVDLYDLDHSWAYSWGIEWNSSEAPITSAQLTFKNIRNWIADPNDILYVSLLNNAQTGVTSFYEGNAVGNYFSDMGGILVDTWTDPDDNLSTTNLTITFNEASLATLNSFSSDGLFGIGFDPDCHYWNDGIELTINAEVPEPATILLFGLGALGLAGYRRRSRK